MAGENKPTVVESLVEMLNKHHEELEDAQQERHEQLIANLQYDLVSISNGSNNTNVASRMLQTESKSPLETIRAAGSDLTSNVDAKGDQKLVDQQLFDTLNKSTENNKTDGQ